MDGRADLQFPPRPWYRQKSEASFADALTTLRRKSWENQLSKLSLATTPDDNSASLLNYLLTLVGQAAKSAKLELRVGRLN